LGSGPTVSAAGKALDAVLVTDRDAAAIDREKSVRESIVALVGRVDAVFTRTGIMKRYKKELA
jgi:hypothetical protein